MEKKRNGNFLTQMYHEVVFRKQNDSDFDYLTRNQTTKKGKIQAYGTDERMEHQKRTKLRSRSRIGEVTGNQNDGCIFKDSNKRVFMMRRKTRDIE